MISSGEPEASSEATFVRCWTEWGRLHHVIVGIADGARIPPTEPGFTGRFSVGRDLRTACGPRHPDAVAAANAQLDGFVSLLRTRGIRVDRPVPIDFASPIRTPDFEQVGLVGCMPPRDVLVTVGREILEATMSLRSRWFEYLCYRPLLSCYLREDLGMRHEAAPKPRLTDASFRLGYLDDSADLDQRLAWTASRYYLTTEEEPLFDAADIVRCGRDLFVQHGFTTNLAGIDWLRRHFPELRVHALNFHGDPYPSHIDATFLPLRPGLILANPDRPLDPAQAQLFARNDWSIVAAASPAHAEPPPLCASSLWLSMNVLSLDEKTICVEASEVHQAEQLDALGFEVLPVPLRDAYAFGGGLHCATTDIQRDDDCIDYFPVQ